MTDADAEILDEDRDAGGVRKLLRVAMEGDEDLVCVLVHCPFNRRAIPAPRAAHHDLLPPGHRLDRRVR